VHEHGYSIENEDHSSNPLIRRLRGGEGMIGNHAGTVVGASYRTGAAFLFGLCHYSQLSDVCKNDCYCIWAKNGPEPQDFGVMQ